MRVPALHSFSDPSLVSAEHERKLELQPEPDTTDMTWGNELQPEPDTTDMTWGDELQPEPEPKLFGKDALHITIQSLV